MPAVARKTCHQDGWIPTLSTGCLPSSSAERMAEAVSRRALPRSSQIRTHMATPTCRASTTRRIGPCRTHGRRGRNLDAARSADMGQGVGDRPVAEPGHAEGLEDVVLTNLDPAPDGAQPASALSCVILKKLFLWLTSPPPGRSSPGVRRKSRRTPPPEGIHSNKIGGRGCQSGKKEGQSFQNIFANQKGVPSDDPS
jgi:hypothetical protein